MAWDMSTRLLPDDDDLSSNSASHGVFLFLSVFVVDLIDFAHLNCRELVHLLCSSLLANLLFEGLFVVQGSTFCCHLPRCAASRSNLRRHLFPMSYKQSRHGTTKLTVEAHIRFSVDVSSKNPLLLPLTEYQALSNHVDIHLSDFGA